MIQGDSQNFSGVKKQRISITRVLLKKAHIILMDEGTSALEKIIKAEGHNINIYRSSI